MVSCVFDRTRRAGEEARELSCDPGPGLTGATARPFRASPHQLRNRRYRLLCVSALCIQSSSLAVFAKLPIGVARPIIGARSMGDALGEGNVAWAIEGVEREEMRWPVTIHVPMFQVCWA